MTAWDLGRAEEHLLSLELFGMRFGLERMRRLLTTLGSPQERFGSIHVVGTNGKSSTVRMTAAILEHAGIALSAVGPTTIHLGRAEELLRRSSPSEELFEQAGAIASEDCSPVPDGRGPVDYKRHLAGVLTKRALRRACARALHQEA